MYLGIYVPKDAAYISNDLLYVLLSYIKSYLSRYVGISMEGCLTSHDYSWIVSVSPRRSFTYIDNSSR